jgi:hypothetical protein
VVTNKEIMLHYEDLTLIQQLLQTNRGQVTSLELSTARLVFNDDKKNLVHIIEKNTYKMISFHLDTLKNLFNGKHILLFASRRIDLAEKAYDAIKIMETLVRDREVCEKELVSHHDKIDKTMLISDRIFFGEFIFKFPTTFISILNLVRGKQQEKKCRK